MAEKGGHWVKSAGGGMSFVAGGGASRTYSQQEVLDHIMATNPPEQIKEGRMTVDEWRDKYMTDEPGGYVMANVAPEAIFLPVEAGDKAKVARYTGMKGKRSPAIVLDSNDKIEARFGGGKLDRAYGVQPYTVIDGKHRVEAALARGDTSIRAYVPKRKLQQVIKNSSTVEVQRFAESYFKSKGYSLLRQSGQQWTVSRQGSERTYTTRDLNNIAKNTGYSWVYGGA